VCRYPARLKAVAVDLRLIRIAAFTVAGSTLAIVESVPELVREMAKRLCFQFVLRE
jgi:hypothetical protein